MNQSNQVAFNEQAHDAVYKKYEKIHPEIFNDIEQGRLRQSLQEAVRTVTSADNAPTALDIGCGSGNLSRHLRDLGCRVTAADISEHFLQLVSDTIPDIETHKLNGTDLAEIPDNTFDIAATYSVLHHIPDYLQMVSEMCRVVKPGGVIYIDHEKNEHYWNNEPKLQEFYEKQKPFLLPHKLRRLLHPMWYVHRLRRLKNPRYQAEGDIHVWPDDHVEWDKIYAIAERHGVYTRSIQDFLLFHAHYDREIFVNYQDEISDTRAVLFQK